MIQLEHLNELLIYDDDFMRDEWNQEYDPLAGIESIKAIYGFHIHRLVCHVQQRG